MSRIVLNCRASFMDIPFCNSKLKTPQPILLILFYAHCHIKWQLMPNFYWTKLCLNEWHFMLNWLQKKDEYKELTIKFIHFEKATKNRKKNPQWRVRVLSQIREQMRLGTNLWHEKSILGWFGQPGQYCEKKFGANYEQLLRPVFLCFHGEKIN